MVGSEVDSVQIGMGLPYGVDAAALECYRTCRTQRSVFLNTVLVDVATEVIARISPLTVRTHNDVARRVAWIQLRVDKRKCAVALVEAQGIGGRSVRSHIFAHGIDKVTIVRRIEERGVGNAAHAANVFAVGSLLIELIYLDAFFLGRCIAAYQQK